MQDVRKYSKNGVKRLKIFEKFGKNATVFVAWGRRRRMEDRGQRTEDGGQRTEDRGQTKDDRS